MKYARFGLWRNVAMSGLMALMMAGGALAAAPLNVSEVARPDANPAAVRRDEQPIAPAMLLGIFMVMLACAPGQYRDQPFH